MKLNKMFLIGAMLSLGFASCSKEGNGPSPDNSSVADTHMSVSMSLPQHNRAGDNDYNHVGEYGGIDKINDLTVYVVGDGKIDVRKLSAADLQVNQGANTTIVTAPFQVKSGEKTVYAVVNITPKGKRLIMPRPMLLTSRWHMRQLTQRFLMPVVRLLRW